MNAVDKTEEIEKLAPEINSAIETGDFNIVNAYVQYGYDLNHPLTTTGISLYSQLMCVPPMMLEGSPGLPQKYVGTLKLLKKKDIDVLAIDDVGRTCFHHAAAVGNALGLQVTVQLIKYQHE